MLLLPCRAVPTDSVVSSDQPAPKLTALLNNKTL